MEIKKLADENNELIHKIEKEFIEIILFLEEREQERFRDFTLRDIAKIKSNNKIIRRLSE